MSQCRILGLLVMVSLGGLVGCSGLALEDLLDPTVHSSRELDRDTVIAGLRQALEIGSQRAIDRTSVVDGFLANELIRIVLPEELESMARRLRQLGLGRQVDQLEVSLNRAAEQAVGEARDVLWAEIRTLSFPDAMAILRGGGSSASDFLEQRTSAEIRARFLPIVVEKMETVGLARLYDDLAERYNRLPFVTRAAVDLDQYVTDRALDGLFAVLREEERRIREDPLARATELLRRVFG